jgi:hypothetical protein
MRVVLVIFFLSIRSSYLRNEEHEASEDVFDTIQFVSSEQGAWRVRTFADDQDVHTWSMRIAPDDLVALARQNTEKHYGDVLAEGYVIDTADGIEGVRRELLERGLSEHLEIGPNSLLFWAPEGSTYRTQSKPT